MTSIQITRSSRTETATLAPMAIMASMGSACTIGDAGVSEFCVVGIVVADEGSRVVRVVVLSGPKVNQNRQS